MYKLASRNLQRRHAVDRPQATGGVFAAGEAEQPEVSHLSLSEAVAERQQILTRKAQDDNALVVAKANGDYDGAKRIGAALLQHNTRLSALATHIKKLNVETSNNSELWKRAVRSVVNEETWRQICAAKDKLDAEAKA